MTTLNNRFWKHVDRRGDNDCWLWTASLDGKGYGQIAEIVDGQRKTLRAHRVSYELANGPLADGIVVMHTCDTPACVNPRHLRAGTMKDNTRDMLTKKRNRHGRLPGVSNPFAKFSEQDVRLMRANYHNGSESISEMARNRGVTYQAVYYAIHTGWKHVR